MTTIRERLLERSSVYTAFKRAIRADHHMNVFLNEYVQPKPGERVLDLGCGTGDAVLHLTDVDYVGVDLNEGYIETAKRREAPNATFVNAPVEELPLLQFGEFDCVILVGVLHHLPDDVVLDMLRALPPLLTSGARFAAIDPVWSPSSRSTARVLAALDRGRYVRDDQGYARLISSALSGVSTDLRHDLLAIPYSHCITTARYER